MQLGPAAQRLMATEIYHGIDGELVNRIAEAEPDSKSSSASESGSESEARRHTRSIAA